MFKCFNCYDKILTEMRFYDILVENAKCYCSLKHCYTIDHKAETVINYLLSRTKNIMNPSKSIMIKNFNFSDE